MHADILADFPPLGQDSWFTLEWPQGDKSHEGQFFYWASTDKRGTESQESISIEGTSKTTGVEVEVW